MAERRRWAVVLSAVVVVLVIAAVVAALTGPDESADLASVIDRVVSPDSDDEADGATSSAATEGSPSESPSPLAATTSSKRTAPKVTDVPKPPAGGPSAEQAWQQYLTDTRTIVETNEGELVAIVAQITRALSDGDEDALGALLAPDEGSQAGYLDALAGMYPQIIESAPSGNVNIFTSGGATIYFAYSVVTWTDGGVVSEHTIPIMLRFVDGAWHITTIGDTATDLVFVQSVEL